MSTAEPAVTAKALQCVVVTPERAVLDEACDFVALPMFDGELGVLPGRRPLIGRLGFGELRTEHHGKASRLYVDGGFVQIRGNVVTVLTSKALRAEEIKPATVEESLKKASESAAVTDDALAARLKDQARLRAQLRVAQRASGEPAPAAH